jgi:hypothetical protein
MIGRKPPLAKVYAVTNRSAAGTNTVKKTSKIPAR